MKIASLFPRSDEERFLHPKEIAQRISAAFPDSIVDWERANETLRAQLERLEELGTPPPIIAGHRNLFDNTVYIEVCGRDDPANRAHFTAYLDTGLDVHCGRPVAARDELDRLEVLVSEIAKCLEYDVEFE